MCGSAKGMMVAVDEVRRGTGGGAVGGTGGIEVTRRPAR